MTVSKPRIVVTHWVHPDVAGYLAGFNDALIPSPEEGVFSPRQVADLAAGADGLIACMADRVDDAFLARCPRLRVVSATLKGYGNFNAGACTRRGVWLTIVPGTIIAPTAELAIGLTAGLMRKIAAGDARIRGVTSRAGARSYTGRACPAPLSASRARPAWAGDSTPPGRVRSADRLLR